MGSMNNMFSAFDNVLKAEAEQERLQHEQEEQNKQSLDFLGGSKEHEDEPKEIPNAKQPQRESAGEESVQNKDILNDEMKESFRAETFTEVKTESEDKECEG